MPSGYSKAKRKQALYEKRLAQRAAYQAKQEEIRDALPYELPNKPHITLYKSQHGRKRKARLSTQEMVEVSARSLENVPHDSRTTCAGILNPNYTLDTDTPRFSAIRFPNVVSPEEAAVLKQMVEECKHAGLKSNTTKAHGQAFQQVWVGYWQKYSRAPFLAAATTPKKPALYQATQCLIRAVGSVCSTVLEKLRKWDSPVTNRQRISHRNIHRAAIKNVDKLKHPGRMKAFYEAHPESASTSFARIGGMGSMLAVSRSTAEGTAFHYDVGDDARFYSTIIVLETPGTLHLPETGYKMEVKIGDVVCFLASQQLHRLDVKHDEPGAEQIVFTIWTDKSAMQGAVPSQLKDFYAVEPNTESDDEMAGDCDD